ADVLAAALRVARLDPPGEFLSHWPAPGVARELFPYLAVRRDDLADEFGPGAGFFQFARRTRRRGDQSLDFEFIRIDHQPDHGLLVVGIAADVGEHAEARAFGGADVRGGEEENGEEAFHRKE